MDVVSTRFERTLIIVRSLIMNRVGNILYIAPYCKTRHSSIKVEMRESANS